MHKILDFKDTSALTKSYGGMSACGARGYLTAVVSMIPRYNGSVQTAVKNGLKRRQVRVDPQIQISRLRGQRHVSVERATACFSVERIPPFSIAHDVRK